MFWPAHHKYHLGSFFLSALALNERNRRFSEVLRVTAEKTAAKQREDSVTITHVVFNPEQATEFVSYCCSVTQSYLTLWPHGLQHARLSCPSPTPKVCLNSCPLSRWCHPTISSSVIPFPSCLQSFPASGSFPMSQLFISGGQSTEASASASVPPMNIQDWFPLGLTYLISLQSKGLSRVFSNTTVQKHQFFGAQPLLWALGGRHLWKNAFEHKLPLHLGLLAIANWLTGIQFFHNNLLRF